MEYSAQTVWSFCHINLALTTAIVLDFSHTFSLSEYLVLQWRHCENTNSCSDCKLMFSINKYFKLLLKCFSFTSRWWNFNWITVFKHWNRRKKTLVLICTRGCLSVSNMISRFLISMLTSFIRSILYQNSNEYWIWSHIRKYKSDILYSTIQRF